MKSSINVELIWTDEHGKQTGAKLSYGGQKDRAIDVTVQELQRNYKGKLANAYVTSYGLRGKPGTKLPRQKMSRTTGRYIATYTLMHKNDIVCYVYPVEDRVEIVAGEYLPYFLSGTSVTVTAFEKWLMYRIDNLSRTYMNRVYIARKVGRDREKILRDSCAISIIDNFWVKRSDVSFTWDELKEKRDKNLELANIALTGKSTKPPNFKDVVKDTTSLFALKGAFPKAVYRGMMLKKDNNAEYEVIAYIIGRMLDISVAKAVLADGQVECEIFTSEAISMVHARDLLHLTDYVQGTDDEHRAVYDYFLQKGRKDITKQLERLFVLHYLAENFDFHYENFGFLYDSDTFEITQVAPAYDFNSAFCGCCDEKVFYTWIFDKLPEFMSNHPDIKMRLNSSDFLDSLKQIPCLKQKQKKSILMRAKYLGEMEE